MNKGTLGYWCRSGSCIYWSIMKRIADIIPSLLILLYSYTVTSKILQLTLFQNTMKQVFGSSGPFIGIVIILAEVFISLLLLFPNTIKKGLFLSLMLLSSFTIYLIYMVLFYPHLPCSCGGVISGMSWKQHIFFNCAFIIGNVFAFRKYPSKAKKTETRNHLYYT